MQIKTNTFIIVLVGVFLLGLALGYFAQRGANSRAVEKYQATIDRLREINSELIGSVRRAGLINRQLTENNNQLAIRVDNLERSIGRYKDLVEFQQGIVDRLRETDIRIREEARSASDGITESIRDIGRLIEAIEDPAD
jgi:glucose-6-phosphate-specific signal transduction histidine kinase